MRAVVLFLAMLLPAIATAVPIGRPISIADVQKLKAPLTLAAVEKAFQPSQEHPGPRVSYRCADHEGMSLWFWYWRPQRPGEVGKDEVIIGCVILATTITEEKKKVIWPPEAVHEPAEKVIRQVMDRYAAPAK